MKSTVSLLFFLLIASCTGQGARAFQPGTAGASGAARQPVLVELFTSEGCASCPPAEKNLAYLQSQQPYGDADIITLAFHVDYWDNLGWKDPFASPLFTQRQRVYDRKFRTGSIYTPQMVVDGDIEFVGSKLDKAEKAISRSLKNEKGDITLSLADDILTVDIRRMPKSEAATVYLALAEDGLSSKVAQGENMGKTLAHVAVARTLTGLGRIEAGETEFRQESAIDVGKGWDRKLLKAVVFVQENHSRNVLAVGSVRLLNP